MFENMTKRERLLALLVAALVPISLAFIGIFWFIDKYSNNNLEVVRLMDQVDEEENQMSLATKANQRRIYYRTISLPSDVGDAANDYQIWLKDLVRDDIKMDFKSVTPRDGGEIKFKNKLIGRTKTFTLLATADLPQLTRFLQEFYSVDLLHRINSIKIIPLSTGSANEKRVRSGKLSLIINLEVVSMVDADEQREFTKSYRELARTAEDYQNKIVRRNIFGPANNTPAISIRPSSSYTSNIDIRVPVTGEDADENDLLSFELLESAIVGVKLVQTDEKSRRAILEVPGQNAGKYEFKVAVRDNGFPSKMNETTVSVTFKDRIVKKTPPPPPKPVFQFAKETLITGIVKDTSDSWMIWVKIRPTGERLQLKIGDSFQLDDKEWVVQSIMPDEATLKVENRLLTFRPTDRFNNPRREQELNSPAAAETETSIEDAGEVIKNQSNTGTESQTEKDSTKSLTTGA